MPGLSIMPIIDPPPSWTGLKESDPDSHPDSAASAAATAALRSAADMAAHPSGPCCALANMFTQCEGLTRRK